VDRFGGKLAAVADGGSGSGRELASQLATASGSVAGCDLNPDTNRGNHSHGLSGRPPGVRFTGHTCDITDEEQVQPFRDVLLEQHGSDHVDLVRANAWTSGATV